jgi:hypothetical protein
MQNAKSILEAVRRTYLSKDILTFILTYLNSELNVSKGLSFELRSESPLGFSKSKKFTPPMSYR